MAGFEEFVSLVFNSVLIICPQPDYLMRMWQIKHAENPELAEQVLSIEGRDCYERTDNFNVFGLFCFFAIRMRKAFFEWAGNSALVNQLNIQGAFNIPATHVFSYELYQPLLAICMRSKSETIKALAFEITHIFAYLIQGK